MQYQHYTADIKDLDKIIVDTNDCGIGLELSHWPGSNTPTELKADLSVEIVLRLLSLPDRKKYLGERTLVTNNHFDTDGLLSIWALLNPEEALKHTDFLIAASEAGDFFEFTSPKAVQFDLVTHAIRYGSHSPLASDFTGRSSEECDRIATEMLLTELPNLLYNPQLYKDLWQETYSLLVERLQACRDGQIDCREWPEERLSILISSSNIDEYNDKLFTCGHFSRNMFAKGHRILEAIHSSKGTMYRLHYREFMWYDIVSRQVTPKHLMIRAAEKLNNLELAGSVGTWATTKWTPALCFSAAEPNEVGMVHYLDPLAYSSLSVDVVERVLREELNALDTSFSLCA